MNKKKFKDLIISEYKRDFYKKSREEEMYSKIRKMLIIHYSLNTFSFSLHSTAFAVTWYN